MIIYVDIDGTICSDSKKNDNEKWDYTLAEPNYENILKINKLYNEGHEIVYWTARGGTTDIDWSGHTKQQLEKWGCRYTRIETQRKPSFDLFIDDKAKRIEELN